MVKINGKQYEVAGLSLAEFLVKENYNLQRIAVECNGELIPKSEYETKILNSQDSIEIVSFVGGG